jgi:hypothetical protein
MFNSIRKNATIINWVVSTLVFQIIFTGYTMKKIDKVS